MHRGSRAAISLLATTAVLCLCFLHSNTDDQHSLVIEPRVLRSLRALERIPVPDRHWACRSHSAEVPGVPLTPLEFNAELNEWARYGWLLRQVPESAGQLANREDIAQQALSRILVRNPAMFANTADLRAYAVEVIKSVMVDLFRRRSVQPPESPDGSHEFISREAAQAGKFVASPEEELDREQLRKQRQELLRRVLRELSPVHRQSVFLRHIKSWSVPDIARHRGVKISTAYSDLRNAMARLRKIVSKLTRNETS